MSMAAHTTLPQSKSRVLVIADQQTFMVGIISRLFDAGWLIDASTTQSWMSRSSRMAKNYSRILFVIDADFRRRFGSIIHEMSAIVKNCSAHAPVYLLCENGYEPCFSPWLPHVKQVLEFESDQNSLRYSIDYILSQKTESAVNNRKLADIASVQAVVHN